MDKVIYDLIIIGAGPAGMSASIYASRYHIKHLIIAKDLGGTITLAHKVENYPGLFSGTGFDLAEKLLHHVRFFKTEIKNEEAYKITKNKKGLFEVSIYPQSSYQARSLIIATGTRRRELGVPGEKQFLGKGVSYCVTCDAAFFKGKTVVVVGGANAACSGAIYLSHFAKKVYLLYRKDALRAEPAWITEIKNKKNIEIIYEINIQEIKGKLTVTEVILDKPYKGEKALAVDGVFIEVGGVPLSEFTKNMKIKTDELGYIVTDKNMATNVPGVYAAGDINSFWREFQQVITATCEGALSAHSVYQFLRNNG